MSFADLVDNLLLLLLLFARVMALLRTAPLVSSSSIPGIGRAAMAFFTAFIILPWVAEGGYPVPGNGGAYALALVAEMMIGIIMGLFLNIISAAFTVSGQFYSTQMGFGASTVFDPLAQVEIPLIGNFLNLLAMYVFIIVGGFKHLFLNGILKTFQYVNPSHLALSDEGFITLLLSSLGVLFQQALKIAFPVLGTLLLVSISMGLLAKAAPQMNLLMLGFPIKISVGFIILALCMPPLVMVMEQIILGSLTDMLRFFEFGRADI